MINEYNKDDRTSFTFKKLDIKIEIIANLNDFIKVVNFIKGLSRTVEIRLLISSQETQFHDFIDFYPKDKFVCKHKISDMFIYFSDGPQDFNILYFALSTFQNINNL